MAKAVSKKPWYKRPGLILGYFGLVLLGLVVFCIITLTVVLNSPRLTNASSRVLYPLLYLAYKVDGISFNLAKLALTVDNLVLYTDQNESETVMTLKHGHIEVPYSKLLTGKLQLENARIDGFDFALLQDEQGVFAWELMRQPPKKKDDTPFILPGIILQNIQFSDSSFILSNKRSKFFLSLDIPRLGIGYWNLRGKGDGNFALKLVIKKGDEPDVSLGIKSDIDTKLTMDYDLENELLIASGDFGLVDNELRPYLKYVPTLAFSIQAKVDFPHMRHDIVRSRIDFKQSYIEVKGMVDPPQTYYNLDLGIGSQDVRNIAELFAVKNIGKGPVPVRLTSNFLYNGKKLGLEPLILDTKQSQFIFHGSLNDLDQAEPSFSARLQAKMNDAHHDLSTLNIEVLKRQGKLVADASAQGGFKDFSSQFQATIFQNVALRFSAHNTVKNSRFASDYQLSISTPSLRQALRPILTDPWELDSPLNAVLSGKLELSPLRLADSKVDISAYDHRLTGRYQYDLQDADRPIEAQLQLENLKTRTSTLFKNPKFDDLRTQGQITIISQQKKAQGQLRLTNRLFQMQLEALANLSDDFSYSYSLESAAFLPKQPPEKLSSGSATTKQEGQKERIDFTAKGTGNQTSFAIDALEAKHQATWLSIQNSSFRWGKASAAILDLRLENLNLDALMPPPDPDLRLADAPESPPQPESPANTSSMKASTSVVTAASNRAAARSAQNPPGFDWDQAVLTESLRAALNKLELKFRLAVKNLSYQGNSFDLQSDFSHSPSSAEGYQAKADFRLNHLEGKLNSRFQLQKQDSFTFNLTLEDQLKLRNKTPSLQADLAVSSEGRTYRQWLENLLVRGQAKAVYFSWQEQQAKPALHWLNLKLDFNYGPDQFSIRGQDWELLPADPAQNYLGLDALLIRGEPWKLGPKNRGELVIQEAYLKRPRAWLPPTPTTASSFNGTFNSLFAAFKSLEIKAKAERKPEQLFQIAGLPKVQVHSLQLHDGLIFSPNPDNQKTTLSSLQASLTELSLTEKAAFAGKLTVADTTPEVQLFSVEGSKGNFAAQTLQKLPEPQDRFAWFAFQANQIQSKQQQGLEASWQGGMTAQPEENAFLFDLQSDLSFQGPEQTHRLQAELNGLLEGRTPRLAIDRLKVKGRDFELTSSLNLSYFLTQPLVEGSWRITAEDLGNYVPAVKDYQKTDSKPYAAALESHFSWQNNLLSLNSPNFRIGDHKGILRAEVSTASLPAQSLPKNRLELQLENFPALLDQLLGIKPDPLMLPDGLKTDEPFNLVLDHSQQGNKGIFYLRATTPFDQAYLNLEVVPNDKNLKAWLRVEKFNLDAYGLSSKQPAEDQEETTPPPKAANSKPTEPEVEFYNQPFWYAPILKERLQKQSVFVRLDVENLIRNKTALLPNSFELVAEQDYLGIKKRYGPAKALQGEANFKLSTAKQLPLWHLDGVLTNLDISPFSLFLAKSESQGRLNIRHLLNSEGNSLYLLTKNLTGSISLTSSRLLFPQLDQIDRISCIAVAATRAGIFTEKIQGGSRIEKIDLHLPIRSGKLWFDQVELDLAALRLREGGGYFDLKTFQVDSKLKLELFGNPRYKTCSMPTFAPTFSRVLACQGSLLKPGFSMSACNIPSKDDGLLVGSALTSLINPLEWAKKVWYWVTP